MLRGSFFDAGELVVEHAPRLGICQCLAREAQETLFVFGNLQALRERD
jgi:hypothetical protein